MNEAAARETVLVRAYEREPSSPSAPAAWSEEDRAWATQAAAEVEGEQAAADLFVARRSALAIERLGGRDKQVRRLLRAVTWRPWVAWALASLAFVLGFAADGLGSDKRIHLLAPPLLGLLAWNLMVYLVLLARGVWSLFARHRVGPGPLARAVALLTRAASRPPKRQGSVPAAAFLEDWARASSSLTTARLGRVLHVGAIAFALGALGGIYLRGLAFEYRAGWESTFLGAGAVRALLGAVLGPASALTGIALPDTAGYAALRFSAGPGVLAAPWLHLFAVTVGLVVLLPRLLLALMDRWIEARQVARFPLRLDDAYFSRLTRVLRGTPAAVRVVPYSYHLSPQATLGLRELLTRTFGRRATVSVAPTVAFGDEDRLDAERAGRRRHGARAPLRPRRDAGVGEPRGIPRPAGRGRWQRNPAGGDRRRVGIPPPVPRRPGSPRRATEPVADGFCRRGDARWCSSISSSRTWRPPRRLC